MKLKREVSVKVPIPFRQGSLVLLMLALITSAQVYAAQDEGNDNEIVPRTLEMLDVGYKLPVEIISVRNLRKKKHWLRDLEIEIRNVSAKPIYYVHFTLFFPEVKGDSGAPLGLYLEYGRSELIHPREQASVNDRPIGSGETVILTVGDRLWRGYENRIAISSASQQAKCNVRLVVLTINFGDGTAFVNGGLPYPRNHMDSRPLRWVRIPLDSE